MTTKKLFVKRDPRPLAMIQDHLDSRPRHIVVDKDRKFLLFLEAEEDRIPITLELEDGYAKITINYAENRTLCLLDFEQPDTILGLFELQDDSDNRFAKLCKVALAIWKVSPPTYDLLISTKRLGLSTGSIASDKILWWKVAGQEKGEPFRTRAITDPLVQKRLLAYELVDTEVKQFEVIRKYRKLDDLAIARQAGATHKDRHGCFFKKGPSGILVGEVFNGSIDWQLSLHYHMPDTTEVL